MLYCEKCKILTAGPCHRCGRKVKKLREPAVNDPVFLISCRYLHAGIIEPLLADNCIPIYRDGALGAALATKFGSLFEIYNFYVPFGAYPDAYDLLSGLFADDPEIISRLESYGMTSTEIAALSPVQTDNAPTAAARYWLENGLIGNYAADHDSLFHLSDALELTGGMSVAEINNNGFNPWRETDIPEDFIITRCSQDKEILSIMEQEAVNSKSDAFDFCLISGDDLPFTDSSIDVLLLNNTPITESLLSEAQRVLKRTGKLCLITETANSMPELERICGSHSISLKNSPAADSMQLLYTHFTHVYKSSHAIRLELTEARPLINYIRLLGTAGAAVIENTAAEISEIIDRQGSFSMTKTFDFYICTP